MTLAVCFNCGNFKLGAFTPCPKCAQQPQTDDELMLSLAMTDHNLDRANLEYASQDIASGNCPQLDPQ